MTVQPTLKLITKYLLCSFLLFQDDVDDIMLFGKSQIKANNALTLFSIHESNLVDSSRNIQSISNFEQERKSRNGVLKKILEKFQIQSMIHAAASGAIEAKRDIWGNKRQTQDTVDVLNCIQRKPQDFGGLNSFYEERKAIPDINFEAMSAIPDAAGSMTTYTGATEEHSPKRTDTEDIENRNSQQRYSLTLIKDNSYENGVSLNYERLQEREHAETQSVDSEYHGYGQEELDYLNTVRVYSTRAPVSDNIPIDLPIEHRIAAEEEGIINRSPNNSDVDSLADDLLDIDPNNLGQRSSRTNYPLAIPVGLNLFTTEKTGSLKSTTNPFDGDTRESSKSGRSNATKVTNRNSFVILGRSKNRLAGDSGINKRDKATNSLNKLSNFKGPDGVEGCQSSKPEPEEGSRSSTTVMANTTLQNHDIIGRRHDSESNSLPGPNLDVRVMTGECRSRLIARNDAVAPRITPCPCPSMASSSSRSIKSRPPSRSDISISHSSSMDSLGSAIDRAFSRYNRVTKASARLVQSLINANIVSTGTDQSQLESADAPEVPCST